MLRTLEEKKMEPRYIRIQEGTTMGSLRITVPRVIADNLGMKKSDTVKVSQEGKRIIVEAASEGAAT